MNYRVTDALRTAEKELVNAVVIHLVGVLEGGQDLGYVHEEWMHHLSETTLARIRTLRSQLVERDLYELLYGNLPPNAVDPQVLIEPDFAVADPGDRTP